MGVISLLDIPRYIYILIETQPGHPHPYTHMHIWLFPSIFEIQLVTKSFWFYAGNQDQQ